MLSSRSGKTTLLKNILESPDHGLKIAVIVNDMAELNIDAALVQQSGVESSTSGQIVQTEREVVSLQNGCICCTLRGDLIREIARIRRENSFDYVLIESTGIAEPQQVAEGFCYDPTTAQIAQSEEQMLWTQAQVDTCVTVIDVHSFPYHFGSLRQFADDFSDGLDTSTDAGVKEGEKSIATLLVEQVEFANVILLNKTDLASEAEKEKALKVIKTLNPNAKILTSQYAKIPLTEILNTGLFDMKAAAESPGWLLTLKEGGSGEVVSEADEYGVGTFVYRARKPFHPKKFANWMDSIMHFANEWRVLPEDVRKEKSDEKHQTMLREYGNVLRAKGFCWMAGRDTFMIGVALSGRIGGLAAIMPWYTLIPRDQWGVEDPKDLAVINGKFEEPHGDRRQEIVFIGTDLNVDGIRDALDACLLTKKELKHYKFYSDKGYP